MMAEMGADKRLKVIMMLNIWIPLPVIHAMKHINKICLIEPVALWYSACRSNTCMQELVQHSIMVQKIFCFMKFAAYRLLALE